MALLVVPEVLVPREALVPREILSGLEYPVCQYLLVVLNLLVDPSRHLERMEHT